MYSRMNENHRQSVFFFNDESILIFYVEKDFKTCYITF